MSTVFEIGITEKNNQEIERKEKPQKQGNKEQVIQKKLEGKWEVNNGQENE